MIERHLSGVPVAQPFFVRDVYYSHDWKLFRAFFMRPGSLPGAERPVAASEDTISVHVSIFVFARGRYLIDPQVPLSTPHWTLRYGYVFLFWHSI